MRTEELLRYDEAKPLRVAQQEALDDIDLLCYRAWQKSSADMQSKYNRFSPARFKRKSSAELHLDESISDTRNILKGLVGIEDFSLADERRADKVLEAGSFGCCLLGGVASEGDLILTIKGLQGEKDWSADVLGPVKMLDLRSLGKDGPLVLFLNRLLKQASKELSAMQKETESLFPCRHASTMWFLNSKGKVCIDVDKVRTNYYLYSSLLELVEGPGGEA
jgi:hypothetical protein